VSHRKGLLEELVPADVIDIKDLGHGGGSLDEPGVGVEWFGGRMEVLEDSGVGL
jgi:hypothetical protein